MISAQNQKAFTLVELIVVVSLIAIITGGILPGFNNYLTNQGLRQAQSQIIDDLRTVQNKALNGELATTQLGGNNVQYWGIQFSQTSRSYQQFISVNTGACNTVTRQNIRTSDLLPSGNVIRSPTVCVFFSIANGDAVFSTGGSSATIITGQPSGGTCRRLNISANGLIVADNSTTGC